MKKNIIFIVCIFLALLLDQIIKQVILHYGEIGNPLFQSKFIDIVLVFNKGVAFSLGSFFGEWLKWIILALLFVMFFIIKISKDLFENYYIYFGLILGSGFSNVLDRFIHNGVVDYIFWHYGFNFAVFNLADSIINISIACIIIQYLYKSRKEKNV